MGLGILPSALLAWPAAILIFGNVWPPDSTWLVSILAMSSIVLALGVVGAKIQSTQPRWTTGFFLAWLVAQPFVLALIGWPVLSAQLWISVPSLSLQLGVILAPSLLLVVVSQRAFAFKRLGWLPIAILTSTALVVDGARGIGVTGSSVGLFSIDSISEAQPWGLVVVLLAAGWVSSCVVPLWFLWCVDATQMDDHTSDRIRELWKRRGAKPPEILLWPTGCRAANAVVLNGFMKKRVLLTDRLILSFTEREVDFVMLHELGHTLRCHGLVRLLPTLVAVPLLLVALTWSSGTVLVLSCVGIAVGFVGALVGTCWWTEWDADRQAIKMASSHFGMGLESAAKEYAAVLRKLYHFNRQRKTSWSHPSLEQRLSYCARAVL
jgi:Zn-dependent protease with chaperone function